jgi:hypothetical protein
MADKTLPSASIPGIRLWMATALLLAGAGLPAFAQVDYDKDLDWSTAGDPAAANVKCSWNASATAECWHGGNSDSDVNSHVVPLGLGHVCGPHNAEAEVRDAWGYAEINFSATPPGAAGGPVAVHKDGLADGLTWPCLGASFAAWENGKIKLNSGHVSGGTLRGTVDAVRVRWPSKGEGSISRIEGSRHAWLNDPICIELYEVETDTTIVEQLFSASFNGSGSQGGFSWDLNFDTGLTLGTPANSLGQIDGSVTIGGEASSSWLVNPWGSFGASLVAGVFSASGAWAGLPWMLEYDAGRVVRASLPAASLAPFTNLDYAIPDSLLDPDLTYDLSLDVTTDAGFEGTDVPEPATLALLAFGGLVALRRRNA